jgi:hypothetical protein
MTKIHLFILQQIVSKHPWSRQQPKYGTYYTATQSKLHRTTFDMAEKENHQVTRPITDGDDDDDDDDVIGTLTSTDKGVRFEDDVEIQVNENERDLCNLISPSLGNEDDKTDKQLSQLIRWVEKERQKHRLATAHFESRAFCFMFLPITFLTLGSGIMSMYSARTFDESEGKPGEADGNDAVETGRVNIRLVFVAGILSFCTTFFNALQDRLGLAGRASMHKSASLQLDMVMFALDSLLADSMIMEGDRAHAIDKMETRFLEILSGCTSIIPNAINAAWELMEARTHAMYSTNSELQRIYRSPTFFYNQAANELGGAISSHRVHPRFLPLLGFPLVLPIPDISVERALGRLHQTIDDSNDRTATHGTHTRSFINSFGRK